MKRILCVAFLAMVLGACNQHNKTHQAIVADLTATDIKTGLDKVEEKQEEQKENLDSIVKAQQQPSVNTPSKEPKANPDWDKKIIKIATVSLELKDFNAYNKNIHQNLKAYGAYISKEEQTQTNDATQNSITIKVPVDRFEDLMNSFSSDGIKLLEKKITTEDVTGEVIDTKGRIETKKQVRQQYMELLKQAKNMKDILEVQNEINSITEEVEAAGGRVQYLVHQAAYSTIHLKYLQYTSGAKPVEEEPGFLSKLKEAFKSGGSTIANLAIFLTNLWPLILLAAISWMVIKRWNKSKQPIKQDTAV